MLIDPNLRDEIEEKRDYIRKSSQSALARAKKTKLNLSHEANNNSLRIEHPHAALRYRTMGRTEKRHYHQQLRQIRLNLDSAWQYALAGYKGTLTEDLILEIAGRLDPELFRGRKGQYRSDSVRTIGGIYLPPRPEKVPGEMYSLLELLRNMQDPLDRAAFAHFHIARVHPLPDTNGRTARMAQNVILFNEGYVPATVYEGERSFYFDLLENAIGGYKSREGKRDVSKEERVFFNYIASKVNIGLDHIVDKISRL